MRRLAGVVAAAAIALGGAVAFESPAMAVGCSASACTNKEPTSQGCDVGATTVVETPWYSTVSGDWMVDMRKSSSCSARWARIQVEFCWCNDQDVKARIERRWREFSTDAWYTTHSYVKVPPGSGTYWTNMVGDDPSAAVGDDQFRVCRDQKPMGGTTWTATCSNWVS